MNTGKGGTTEHIHVSTLEMCDNTGWESVAHKTYHDKVVKEQG